MSFFCPPPTIKTLREHPPIPYSPQAALFLLFLSVLYLLSLLFQVFLLPVYQKRWFHLLC